jgi:neutral ceramidase
MQHSFGRTAGISLLSSFCFALLLVNQTQGQESLLFRAGSSMSNITPVIGTSTNGYFQDVIITNIHDETHARCIVLDDGQYKLAIVVADLCLLMRETADQAKQRAHDHTGIPVENILISATHTHSAGTACAVFQSDPDPDYLKFISERIADAIIRAHANLQPARIGWGFGEEPNQVFCRRWKMRPGTALPNPFGGQDQVKMNPGIKNPNLLEATGPVDPELPLVVLRSVDGEYIGLLANYSLHYVGFVPAGDVSADYFAVFARRMEQLLSARDQKIPFVGIMSNGTSGDINNIDFSGRFTQATKPYIQMEYVANRLAAEAVKVIQNMEYQDWVPLAARREEIRLGVRRPTAVEVQRAQAIVAQAGNREMKTLEEIYARETLFMKDYPAEQSVILQVLRIGSLAIAAIPCEPFAEIGLELKDKSPFADMFTISLANAYHGYLPTPAQHVLGGYETWRARSSYLEVDAAPKVIETLLKLMNELK